MLKYKTMFFISPPFYSHFNPILNLAKSFHKQGVKVYIGCSMEFEKQALDNGLNFYKLNISKNRNVKKAESTKQPESERARLEEFFESTKIGPAQTLMTQSRHRKADMLYDPAALIESIKTIDNSLDIDIYVVDILSYSVTLALYVLDLDFITFCPPHPLTIPTLDMQYGVPKSWPSAIKVKKADHDKLNKVAKDTQSEFTEVFNRVISKYRKNVYVDNAFALVSNKAIIYNYFDFDNNEDLKIPPYKIYGANSFKEASLDLQWKKLLDNDNKKILITLGTFLSNRSDVLEKLIKYSQKIKPEAQIIVSAGSNVKALENLISDKVIIREFIPQIAIMPFVDIVIFHGGNNTFTEAMYYGKKLIVLPFSSDQFNLAVDIEKNRLGYVLDPNNFTYNDLVLAFSEVNQLSKSKLDYYSNLSKQRGSDYVAKVILEID